MQASQQVPDAHNPDDLSSETDDNTQLQLDARPVTKCMAVETAFLPAESSILPYEFVINGLGRNMLTGLLPWEKPVILSGR